VSARVGRLGFTGTRKGMTLAQWKAVSALLAKFAPSELHHGDCVGADSDAFHIATNAGILTTAHPPLNPKLRAFTKSTVILPPAPYDVRNMRIVDVTEMLIATPLEDTEQPKGGTWNTVRYARGRRPVVVVWPDGRRT
jgi:hypothetical protein